MKTVQIYFSKDPNDEPDYRPIYHKATAVGSVRAVLISDCDINRAGNIRTPRPGEIFVGAVAIE